VLALLAGCGSADSSVEKIFRDGIAQIRTAQPSGALHDQLARTLTKLRQEHPSAGDDRRGKALAIRGFTLTLRGIQARLDMAAKDSGKLEAAVRDAQRSDRYLNRGAEVLRAAGRTLDVPVGVLDGH
jgi:hypothetical protein